ncbi:ADP-sugar pyrophosphatase isoform X2 [Lingula anatina]|uniref:ADP-sugar pyrophosphatase n=1 Tax=Lingula anatina TaxID=7574 RepID=A0A1S3IR04_LINAN|nr:ADP-sugar pyrophosphatase isoform X2 [Lingula anatina]|eukprot:XP_013400637.1 ADP-sugar pyrophosphatase isoform X2 [Lingula anatina]
MSLFSGFGIRCGYSIFGRSLSPCFSFTNKLTMSTKVSGNDQSAGETTSHKGNSDRAKFINQEVIGAGKWISLNRIKYQDPSGRERIWEAVFRTTRTERALDAVVIMPVLKRLLKYDCVVLVKQYRPPMKCCTIEFPAGLIDAGESPEETAVRELEEETGYTGKIKHISPVTCLDPGIGNCTVCIATAEIDGDDPVNKKPKAKLDDSEFIEVISIPVNELLERLNEFAKQDVVVDARVYTYAVAIKQTTKTPNLEEI